MVMVGRRFFVVTAASAGGVALYLNLNPARGLVKANGTGQANTARLYTVEELSVHDSTHPRQRLLSILGEVFDVSRKPEVYGASLATKTIVQAGIMAR